MKTAKETVLDVEGMTCSSCVRQVNAALRQVDGVSAVNVRLSEGKVAIHHDADAASVDRLVKALSEAGYEARPRAP